VNKYIDFDLNSKKDNNIQLINISARGWNSDMLLWNSAALVKYKLFTNHHVTFGKEWDQVQ